MSVGTESVFFDSLTADPVSPEAGQIWFRSDLGGFYFFDGSSVQTFGGFNPNDLLTVRSTGAMVTERSTGNVVQR